MAHAKWQEQSYRVYYEDTDAGGVVYYANYLKFAERARTDYLRRLGLSQTELKNREGLLFVVRHVELDLLAPAKLDDLLTVKSHIAEIRGASLLFLQEIWVKDRLYTKLAVTVVSVSETEFKPIRLPSAIISAIAGS